MRIVKQVKGTSINQPIRFQADYKSTNQISSRLTQTTINDHYHMSNKPITG